MQVEMACRARQFNTMNNLLLYFKRQKTLVALIKSLGEQLREERKLRRQWQMLAMNSAKTLEDIEQSVTDARERHRDRADRLLYGD